MHGSNIRHAYTEAQDDPSAKFAGETPQQQCRHRDIARKYASKSRKRGRHGPSVAALRIRDLQKFLTHRYGTMMPDDDSARDDLLVLLHHVAQLGDTHALRASVLRWCPWITHGEFEAIIAEINRRPLRWRADSLARRIGLDDATRTRLGITTIGAVDCTKAQRTMRAKRRDAAYQQQRRMKAGAKPRALSEARLKPWLALGISESTYRRRKRQVDSNSSGAALMYVVTTKRCHVDAATRAVAP